MQYGTSYKVGMNLKETCAYLENISYLCELCVQQQARTGDISCVGGASTEYTCTARVIANNTRY